MSYSIIAFLWRKPGLTPEQFHHHYEANHMPLLYTQLGQSFPQSHTRFYLPRQPSGTDSADTSNANYAPSIFFGSTADFDYDACASIVFKDEVAFDAFYALLKEPEVAKILGEDEEKFLWRQKLIVAVAGAPCVSLQPQSA